MIHPVDEYVGQRIREERVLAGRTQDNLASKIGVKFQQLQKYETAVNRVSCSRLWEIARALGVPITSILPDTSDTLQGICAAAKAPSAQSRNPNRQLFKMLSALDRKSQDAIFQLIEPVLELSIRDLEETKSKKS